MCLKTVFPRNCVFGWYLRTFDKLPAPLIDSLHGSSGHGGKAQYLLDHDSGSGSGSGHGSGRGGGGGYGQRHLHGRNRPHLVKEDLPRHLCRPPRTKQTAAAVAER